jgi:hypothetical protein
MAKNLFRIPDANLMGLDTFEAATKQSLKQPFTGVTQGGSSRKDKGARVAATTGEVKQPQRGNQNA